jgi:hypothetical protein
LLRRAEIVNRAYATEKVACAKITVISPSSKRSNANKESSEREKTISGSKSETFAILRTNCPSDKAAARPINVASKLDIDATIKLLISAADKSGSVSAAINHFKPIFSSPSPTKKELPVSNESGKYKSITVINKRN